MILVVFIEMLSKLMHNTTCIWNTKCQNFVMYLSFPGILKCCKMFSRS